MDVFETVKLIDDVSEDLVWKGYECHDGTQRKESRWPIQLS